MNKHGRQCHPLALTAREFADLLLKIGDAQLGQRGFGFVFVQPTKLIGMSRKYLFQHGEFVILGRYLMMLV